MSSGSSMSSGSAPMPRRSSLKRSRSRAIGPRLFSRRGLIGSGTSLGGALLIASAGRRTVSGQSATPEVGHDAHADAESGTLIPAAGLWEPADLIEPEVRQSVDGVLETELHVEYAYVDTGGYRLFMRTYGGAVPGPTLRVQPGDTLRIRLNNDLPPNRSDALFDQDLPQQLNTTNFHFHGSHVSPDGISDNIFRVMDPGQSSDIQIAIGMAGALIVEGDFANVPEIAEATERLLLINQVVFDEWRMVEGFETVFPEGATRFFTINGQREPIIRMRPGEVQRWRILHAGYQDDIFMALDGHELHQIARDGIALSHMDQQVVRPGADPAADPEAILLAPAQRVDVLVQAGAPGAYALRALPNFQGYDAPTGP